MIWTTAKSTDVNRRHRPRPTRASGFGRRAVAGAVRTAAGVATRRTLDADGEALDRGGRARAATRAAAKSSCRSSRSSSPTETRSRPGRDPGGGELRVGHLALRRRRRVDDHRVDAAERGGQLGQGQRIDDRPAGRRGRRRPRRPASRRRRPAGTGATATSCWGWLGRPGIEDALHAVLTFEPGRQCRGRPGVALDADGQGQDPAQDEERIERPEVAPVSIWTFSTCRISSARPATTPGDDVAVAGQELRRRLDDEVRPELERAADVRRGERVVDDVRRAVLVGEPGDRRVVGHDGRRVGDGLGVDDPRSARRRWPRRRPP